MMTVNSFKKVGTIHQLSNNGMFTKYPISEHMGKKQQRYEKSLLKVVQDQ